jgi:teichuronic acid biosynthesis glycosyltransferase TuaC
VKVAVVAEYYPRQRDPVLGIWAHRQALAARDAGADVKVLVLERPIPPTAAVRRPWRLPRALSGIAHQPARDELDGIEIRYVRFVAGDRNRTYASWHVRATKPLGEALTELQRNWQFDLVHAHYALPAGGAAAPWTREHGVPMVVSIHGGDVLGPLLLHAAEILCNSRATLERVADITRDEERLRVVHLGASPPADPPPKRTRPTVATLAHVIPRKRHADVLEAIQGMDHVDWLVIGDGPELPALQRAASELGLTDRIHFTGQLAPDDAIRELASAHVMALPSEDEAFGVAYVEALACGVPAIGLLTEGGPAALADAIQRALEDPELAAGARHTAAAHFSWERCGRDTVAAYRDALAS